MGWSVQCGGENMDMKHAGESWTTHTTHSYSRRMWPRSGKASNATAIGLVLYKPPAQLFGAYHGVPAKSSIDIGTQLQL